MRELKAVVVNEESNPLPRVFQAQEVSPLQAFAPQRSPDAFNLAQRLRRSRPCHDLIIARLLKLAAELALAAPCHLLRTVVRWLTSENRLPFGPPRGYSIKPLGPSCTNRFFQS
jgi:hypothetical protein